MTTALELLEHVPIPAYAFRAQGGDFVLEVVNVVARERNPALMTLRGKPMVGLYQDQPQVIEDARRCATAQVVVARELPVRRYDRTEPTQFLRLTFVPAPPEHILLFLQDVANPEVAQIAVSEAEARYQSLMASLPDGVLVRGTDGRILFCNEVAVELFGATSQASLLGEVEALAQGLQLQTEEGQLVEPGADPSRKVLGTGKPEPGRILAVVGRGKLRWVRVAAQPIRSSQGALTGSVATFTEITDRVNAQGALRESAARLDLALSAAKMGVWEFEPGTDIGWWSPNLDALFALGGRGRGMGGFIARVHPEDRPRITEEAGRLVSEGQDGDGFEHEYRIVGEDQVTRWARVRGRVSRTGNRRVLGGTIMDITDQHSLEMELRRSSRLESIGRLAGGVAHDFNNLLAAMLGSVELLEAHCPAIVREELATVRHSAIRARDLTRQLLAFARRQPVAWQTMDLAAMVRGVELMLRRLVGPSIAMHIFAEGPALVRADPSLLEQVLVNLIANAKDAMPEGGRLEIRIRKEARPVDAVVDAPEVAILEVSDSGVGMDEETQKRVFDPFFTTKAHGTGLGLASSYGIVQQHQGAIQIDSQPGQGTRFRVVLPALTEDLPPASVPVRAVSAEAASGTLLLVDDEGAVRVTVTRLAQSLGYGVIAAGSGAEALELAERHAGDIRLLLCDLAMPGEDGPSVATRLRARLPRLKVLFMSGYSAEMNAGRLAGAHFLQKPFTRSELAEKLAEFMHD
jgi:two-component system cell cycle sensor histidine kinase/response regulator CckA